MWTFRAMNTDVRVSAPGLAEAAEAAVAHEVAAIFAAAEQRFSRFLPDSELARLNRAIGATPVSREMIETLAAVRGHVDATHGLFDPTIGAAVVAAGYDRSFDELERAVRRPLPAQARFGELQIDEAARTVVRPRHVQLDLGGIVKGRTVDRAAARVPSPCAIDAGGDIMLAGDGPDGTGWPVEVEDPADPRRTITTLRVRDRGVATSAPNRRRWRASGTPGHHLIDPRTRQPACSDLAQVTVVAPTTEEADVLAKVAFLHGARAAARWLEERGVGGVLVARDGTVRLVGDLEVLDA